MRIVDLSIRARVVEEMDRLDSPPDRLYRTLAQFQRVNRIFTRVNNGWNVYANTPKWKRKRNS